LTIRVANGSELVGIALPAEQGLLGRAIAGGAAVSGALGDCGEAVIHAVKPTGGQVLVAPISSGMTTWGVVVVVQRRGALFPDDDLAMLAQLARTTAVALDHARLVVERREQERQVADRRLRELESRVGLMLDSIKDYAMLLLDDTGRIAAWHHGAEHLFGYRPDQITDRSAAPMYDVSASEYEAWLAEARVRRYAEREGPCRRSDGSTFVGATTIRPLVSEPGVPPGFVVVTHDVTERRNLEDRLRQGQKMEAIGQLAGGVAHDFNNLLTAILGYADWLDRDLAGDPRRPQVSEIQRAAERAADLTRQLLAFSRRQTLQLASVDLSRLVHEVAPMLRRLIGEPIEVADAAVSSGQVHGDRSQLEQVVLNLAVNARDAMPDGGRLTIRTDDVRVTADDGTVPPGSYVRLEVQDTGTGMSAETRQRAFEPFFTTKEVGRGTGLGLSTVYGIVQQMNGLIEVESEIDRGTTFRLYFPTATAGTAAGGAPAGRDGQRTLLLVEDDESIRTYLTSVLESTGYRVLAADHPRTALALTEEWGGRIDLVISDVVMPGSTGPELVRLLGQARPGLSALFISGYGRDEVAPIAGGPDAHLLQKPFSSAELLTRVREILSAA
jgi:PAS domain S-box-containing protein